MFDNDATTTDEFNKIKAIATDLLDVFIKHANVGDTDDHSGFLLASGMNMMLAAVGSKDSIGMKIYITVSRVLNKSIDRSGIML